MSRPSEWRYFITKLAHGRFVIFLHTVKQSPRRASTTRGDGRPNPARKPADDLTLHALRHSYATLCAVLGYP